MAIFVPKHIVQKLWITQLHRLRKNDPGPDHTTGQGAFDSA